MHFKTSKLKFITPLQATTAMVLLALLVLTGCVSTDNVVKEKPPVTKVDSAQLERVGQKIFKNETGGELENLIFWSANEDFASLGVGHFIWYPQDRKQGFKETFPGLILYLKANGADVPDWLTRQVQIGSLWDSKQQLEQERASEKFQELQQLLVDTAGLQVAYLFERLENALPTMLSAADPKNHALITERFNTMKASPDGLYPLVDYVNFKGEGTALTERYKGLGWGLLQVLGSMESVPSGPEALAAFAQAADFVLTRRVSNAPIEKNEQRWLAGWRVRLRTYVQP